MLGVYMPPATDPWLRPGVLISPGGAQATQSLLSLQAMAGVGVLLPKSKMAIEQWSVWSWGFSSPRLFGRSTVRALAAGRSISQRGCSLEQISASGFGYPYPLGQAACWPLPVVGGGQAQHFHGFPGSGWGNLKAQLSTVQETHVLGYGGVGGCLLSRCIPVFSLL